MSGADAVRAATAEHDPHGTGSHIAIEKVTRTFESTGGAVIALSETTLDIPAGSFTAVVGPSGCGKTTLLNLVAGLDSPTSGAVSIGERRVDGPYEGLGVVFQRDLLLDWRDILSNVLLQADMRGWDRRRFQARAQELLEMVHLGDFTHRHPSELSGGMRQRASICRALVHDPSVLLMDEPFGALDAITRDQLNVDVSEICTTAGTTVLFVTHSIPEAIFLADQIVVMSPRPGRVVDVVQNPADFPRNADYRQSSQYHELINQVRVAMETSGAQR